MSKHDDFADVLQYHKELETLCEESNNNGTKYRIDMHGMALGQFDGHEEGTVVDMLCNMAKEISLYRYDDTNATIFVAKTRSSCYVLTEKAYKKIRRKIWSLRKSF